MIPPALLQAVQASRGFRGSLRGPSAEDPSRTVLWVVQGATPENATTTDGEGRHVLIYEYRRPASGPTVGQRLQRRRLKAAERVYQRTTAEGRQTWAATAARRRITERNAAVADVAARLTAGPPSLAVWDAGATEWDDGRSRWGLESVWDGNRASWDAGAAFWDGM
jgi:hypothetical protein